MRVEDIVNSHIREDHPVAAVETGYQQALKQGVTALFGEKYGEVVRVLSIGADKPISAELCGGTHIKATGEIGFFKVVSESSVGAGLRRIEAVTGRGAEAYVRDQVQSFHDRIDKLQADIEAGKIQVSTFQKELARKDALSLLTTARDIKGGKLLVAAVGEASIDTLRDMADLLRDRLAPAVIVLGSTFADKPVFLCAVAPGLVAAGYHAGNIIKKMSEIAGGGGGGRPNLAQGGGRDVTKLSAALEAVNSFIR